jgi:hypothetical protein
MKRFSFVMALGLLVAQLVIGVRAEAVEQPPPRSPYCTGEIAGGTTTQVIVPQNASCVINGVTVTGGVYAYPGSSLIVCNSILQNLRATQAYVNIDYASTVLAGIDIIPPLSSIQYSGGGQNDCDNNEGCEPYCEEGVQNSAGVICAHKVVGSVQIHNGSTNYRDFTLGCGYAYYKDSVGVTYNNLFVHIDGLHIKGTLSCVFNNPPAMASNTTATGGGRNGSCVVTQEQGSG